MKAYIVGSLNMDLVLNVDRMPQQGETMFAESFFQNCGGKGANQAIACARLGSEVSMIGKVGNDGYGQNMIENLRQNRVEVSSVSISENAQSGIAFILVNNGDNRIILEKGANARLTKEDVNVGLEKAGKGDILVLQLEVPQDIVFHALNIAEQKRMISILNPAPAVPLSKELLKLVDILILNETEAEAITGIQDEKQWMEALRELGLSDIILTMGGKGSIMSNHGICEHIPARQAEVVDTTAAGDTFIGGIVYALQHGFNLAAASRLATVAASITVTRRGASQSIPTLEEVLEADRCLLL